MLAYSKAMLELAGRLGSATLHEASGKKGALPSHIKPLSDSWRIAAPVFTVAGPSKDNLWLHRAIYEAPAGSVLVHECGKDAEAGYWGGIMTAGAMQQGLAGLVTEGGVRDVAELRGLTFPVFATNICIGGTSKRTDAAGLLGGSVLLGNIVVRTGDLLVADVDGVVVLAQEDAEKVIRDGQIRERDELEIVKRIQRGETTLDIYKFPR